MRLAVGEVRRAVPTVSDEDCGAASQRQVKKDCGRHAADVSRSGALAADAAKDGRGPNRGLRPSGFTHG